MIDIVREVILDKDLKDEDKIKLLKSLKKDIDIGIDIVKGVYRYCEFCDDYYFSQSYFKIDDKVCCPKGHICGHVVL